MKIIIPLVVSLVSVLTISLVIIVSTSVVQARQAQPVYSLKNLGEKQVANGDTVFSVQIKCNIHNDLRYIQQKSGADEWCVTGSPNECSLERIDAAAKACLFDTASKSSIAVSTPPAAIEPVLSAAQIKEQEDRRVLESELMKTEQQMLDLKNKQLELRKRELDLLKKQG